MGYELFKEWEREEKIAEADRKHGYGQNYYESESGVTPYDYTHPDEEQQEAPAMQTEVQPYLANVRNVINLKTQYDADPNFSDPFAPRQAVDDTYTYLSKTKYKDIPVENWTDLDASDVFYREYLSKMAQPVKQETIVEPVVPEFIPQNEAQKAILEGDKNRHVRDWSQLSGSDKFIYGITPSSNVATDAPEATKYTKGIVQAIPTTTVAAKAGSLFGPWGTVIGGGIGLGISAYQTFTGKQVPIAGNVLEALDKPGQWAEQGLGFITQAGKRTWDWATGRHDGSDTRMLLEVLGEMWHDRRQMWEGGKYFMETVASPLLDIPFDVIRKIGGQDWSGYGQVIDPVASDKPVDLIEGTYGIPGMENAGKLWSDLVEHGYSEQVASDMIASGMFSMGSTSWMWADLIGQESVDPLNALPYFTNKAAGKTANILKSSETPTTKAFGDALAAAAKVNKGGLFELGDLMKDQFRTMDVNTLGSWAKRMSGIDPVTGKLSELDVTDPHRKFNWYRKQAELTPESKAIDVSTKANDTLMTQTFEAQDSAQLRAVYDQLSRLDDITPGENSTIVDSAETRTIANGLRDGILNSNATIVMDQFDATVTNRNTLNAVAADLDLTPEKVYDMLRNDPDVFTRRVNEYATAHDGKIGGVEVAAIEPQLKIYTGDKPAPYSLNEVKLLVNASVIDKMSDYYIKAYGIKPDGMFNKMSNLMKDAQSILLLGASPSYAINNVVNNLVTQAAVGALGFMTPSMINDIRTRMGITPTRMGESLAEMRGTENLTGINKKIRDVKTSQNDIFDKVNKAVKQGNDTLGVFGKISRRAEQSMSDNAIAVGINQYWKKRWKKGTGFPEMPVELVALIEAQTPGMTDVIYGAIERGMNMTEVRNGIFGTYIKPGAAETVQSIIGRLFPDEAGLYDEVFVKAGLVDRLEREFTYSDTDAERAAAWNRVKADVESFIGTKRQIDLEMMSDNFKVIFEKEGLPFVSKYMAEAAATRGDIWKRSRDLWEDTYQKISLFNVKRGTDQYKRLIAATAYEVDKAFKVANEAYSQAYKAMLEGLGVSTDENVAIMKNVLDIQDTWGSFYKQETELMDQYYAMVDHDPNAWAKTQAILNGLAKDAFDKEIELQTKIDNSIAEAVKKAVDGDITQLEQNMSVIRAIRERMRDWQIKTRETVADMTESERNAYYKKHNPEYNGMIQEIRDLQVQNGKIIEDNRMNAVPNRKKATVTADDTVKMQHAAQAADVIKERAKVATQGYMDREAIRQAWVDTGISEQAVDLQMKLMDAAEKRWNADNPGKNFYTEGLRIREITREMSDEQGLFQTYAAAVADGSPWYSHMETVITDKFPEKMNAQSVRNWLIKQGVTKQELQWSGMDEYLDSATGQVTKADLQRVVDMDRMKTTLIDTGNGNMLEVQAYKVTSGMAEPQKLFQAFQDGVKGKFEVIDGDVAIRALKAADVTTMVHETGHAFRRTLNDDQMEQFTRWAGFDSVEQFRQLEYQFQNDYKNMTEADRKRYVDSEEKFARGWEQYLIDGSAPTIGLKSVFRKFTQYMLEVYRSVKDLLTKDYSRQGEFVFDGQVLNINAEINGVKLRDIFDSMLSEKAERTPTYAELISKRIDDLRADKANARLDDQTIYRKAVYGVNSDILSPHGSLDQAMQSAIGGNQPFALPDGTIIDDIALYDAIASAQSLRAYNPFGEVRAKETRGNFTTASGINDARTRYEFQYKVIDLNDVTPSHTWLGNQLLNNQEYNAALQPRSRNEFQSVMQIDKIAANLSPDMLLLDSHAIDRGSPIVGADNNVESGNGRVLALLRAKDLYPDAWANYQAELKNNVQNYGIDPESINAYENPILVRERITDMDAVDFAREANKPVALQMTAKENAIDDAKLISDVVLSNMDVLPTETITGALDAKRNAGFVTEFMKKIPDNEAAQYSYQKSPYEFVLNEAGRTRIINAIFAKVYGESADQLLKSFTMSTDSNIKAVESALKDSLPQMAKVEGLINRGSRSAEYSIANDVAIAAQKLSELRKAGVKVEDYVNQIGLPGLEMELTQVQNKLLSFFSEQRNAKKIREFLRDYAAQVENQADVDQSALFAMEPITKEFMIDRALAGEAVAENADVPSLFQMASDAYKQNSQTRFDDGSIVPDTDADNIILTGAINAELQAEYDAFLNKFENIEDRTFAQTYYDWYLSGQEGDAPKAANPFTETKVTKQAEIYADELRRYKQLYDKGVEVDPLSVQPLNGTYLKRTYAFNHGDYVIAANVYHDGKLVAYLPTNSLIADVADNKFMAGSSPEMQKVITVGDESFRVIGLDPDNPKRLVYLDDGIVRSVEPGIIDGVEPSEFAEHVVRPGKQGSVPVNMPEGYALNELKDQFITPVMNEFLNEYQKRIDSQREVNTQGMPAETRALLNQYLDQVQSKMQAEKYRAQKYGYMKKDQAMLNYDRRYGFDSWLTMMMPYQFWYTRSMYNWANRMIDTPGIYSMYARIKELEEKNKRETRYATRFDGRISVYAPYLPSYYGDRIFIDPLGPMFPFSQFGRNIDMIADNENQITQAAKSIIEEQAKIGFITPEEREQALTKQGGIWENAFAQAKMESGKDIGLTGLAGSYFTGPVFIDWLMKIKQGKEDQLTALPITRTGNAIRGILDDTALAGLGKIAQDALSFPEKVMRKAYGAEYHEFGSWGNGAIQKQLASMVGNGEINAETGEKAALEKDGNPHWDEAVRRAREENLYKVPSAGAVNAMVNFLQGKGSIQEIFASLALVPFGGLMYPEGERKTRDKYPSLQQAHLDKESGKNPNAVNEWYDANPDWTFRNLMFNDDPNDLLRQKMIGDLNDMYYGLPYSQQHRMKKELGPDFAAAFLNKETRNYEAIPTDQLVEWVVKSGGKIPNVPDLKVPQVQPINLYPESFANPVDEFYRIESEQYSQHKNLEKVYYALPSEQRNDFLNTFPQLSEYRAWKRSYKDQHPEVQMWQDDRSAYFNEETAINAYAEMSERTRDALRYSLLTDTKLSSVAMMELKSLYAKHANPSFIKDVDAFIKILQQYGM